MDLEYIPLAYFFNQVSLFQAVYSGSLLIIHAPLREDALQTPHRNR